MEATVGFDLRLTGADLDWAEDRRTRHLLRRDVASLRSVDPHVWVRPPGLRPPEGEWLWPDLSSLRTAMRTLDHAGTVVVRITALEEDEPGAEDAEPIALTGESHDLLGYDVADWYLLSGLANCGYSPEEAAALMPDWAPLLNQWHLFGSIEEAAAFAEVTDLRVPEHAPFYAYGIYRLIPA